MNRNHDRRRATMACLMLGAITVAAFWPVARCDFINFDDPDYVTGNDWVKAGLTWRGFVWAFCSMHAANWHPLTWLSHMLDVQWFGLNPSGHHLTNLFFHTANTVLLFLVLRQMTGCPGRSACVAALFAVHPLHVESVAWVSERKDVLSGFFFLLTLWAYGRYARRKSAAAEPGRRAGPPVQAPESRRWVADYCLALGLFALGLLSKPMLVTLPFVLLLLDYWPLQRFSGFKSHGPSLSSPGVRPVSPSRLIVEKLPFFALAIASSVITFLVQKHSGAVESLDRLPFDARVANALIAYATYLEKTVWPVHLAIYYLRPTAWPAWRVIASSLFLAAVSLFMFVPGRGRSYLQVGWLWFLGMLVPVVGLVQVGSQSMADRYTYLPLVGVFMMVVWGGVELAGQRPWAKWALPGAATIAVICCGIGVRQQLIHWRNSQSVFSHCISVTKNNFVAHNSLGVVLSADGKLNEAKAEYLKALEIQPYYADARQNLGVLLTQQGHVAEALTNLYEAVRIRPKSAEVYGKLGLALTAEGRIKEAIQYYHIAIGLNPNLVEALNNLAWILATQPDENLRNGREAVELAERACGLTGDKRPICVGTLAAAYAEGGRYAEAVATGEKARALWLALAQQAVVAGDKQSADHDNNMARRNEELLQLYRAGKPCREPSSQPKLGNGTTSRPEGANALVPVMTGTPDR